MYRLLSILISLASITIYCSCGEKNSDIDKTFTLKFFLSENYNGAGLSDELIEQMLPFKLNGVKYQPDIQVSKLYGGIIFELKNSSSEKKFITPNFETSIKKQREFLSAVKIEVKSINKPAEINESFYNDLLFREQSKYMVIPNGSTNNFSFLEQLSNVEVQQVNSNVDSLHYHVARFISENHDGQIIILQNINFLFPASDVDIILNESDLILNQIKLAKAKKEDLEKYKKKISDKINELLPYSDHPDVKQQMTKLKGKESSYQIKISNQENLIKLYQRQIEDLEKEVTEQKKLREKETKEFTGRIDSLSNENSKLEETKVDLTQKLDSEIVKKANSDIQVYIKNAETLTQLVDIKKNGDVIFYEKRNGQIRQVRTSQKRYDSYRKDYYDALCKNYMPAYDTLLKYELERPKMLSEIEKTYEIYKVLVNNSKSTEDENLPNNYLNFLQLCK